MPKRKEPQLTSAEQKKRFEELAREVGAKNTDADLKKVLKQVALARAKSNPKEKK
jgi:hypothetical protein